MTNSPGTTTESLSPEATPVPQEADPQAQVSFAAPADVEFPAFTASDDAPVSAFGNLVQEDVDLDLLDVNVSHVREVRYLPGQGPREAIPSGVDTPDALPERSNIAGAGSVSGIQPVPAGPVRARRWRTVLVTLAVGILVILGVVAALVLIR